MGALKKNFLVVIFIVATENWGSAVFKLLDADKQTDKQRIYVSEIQVNE